MQKKLLTKTLIIIGVLLVFVYGIFGIPKSLDGDGLRKAVLSNIHLGLDLKGGTYLILQVMVEEAKATKEAVVVTFLEITREDYASAGVLLADK